MNSALVSKYIKITILLLLGFLFTKATGQAIVSFSESGELSLGIMGRGMLVPLFYLSLLIFLLNVDPAELLSSFKRFDITLGHVLLVLPLSLAFGYFSLGIATYGATYSILGIIVVSGFLWSLFLLVTRDDVYGLSLAFVTLPFLSFLEWDLIRNTPLGGGVWGPIFITPTVVYIWLVFLAWAMGRAIRRQGIVRTPLDKYTALWAFFLLISSLLSGNIYKNLQAVYLTFLGLLFFFVVVGTVRTKKDIVFFLSAVTVWGILRVLFSYYQFLRFTDFDKVKAFNLYDPKMYYAIAHVGELALICLFMIPISISAALLASSRLQRLSFRPIPVILSFILICTYVRSGLVVFTLTLPMLFLYRIRSRRYWAVGLIAVVLSGIGYGLVGNWELFSRFTAWDSISGFIYQERMRIDAFSSALKIMWDYPLGIGLDMWNDYFPSYSTLSHDWEIMFVSSAHNLFLHYGTGGGVGALATLIAFVVFVFRQIIYVYRRTEDMVVHTVATGLLWSFSSLAILGSVGGLGYIYIITPRRQILIDIGLLFWTLIGSIMALRNIQARQERDEGMKDTDYYMRYGRV